MTTIARRSLLSLLPALFGASLAVPATAATMVVGRGSVAEELLAIQKSLHAEETYSPRWRELYAAQQALCWADGQFAMAPHKMITQYDKSLS